jgi:pSer/pThr/pTyr-binding forkhead associated (FHA) protein
VSERITIGRAPHCDLVVDDPLVSLIHASLVMGVVSLCIRDEGSTNGTFVNEGRVWGDLPLLPTDRIRIGRTEWTFTELLEAVRNRHKTGTR